MTVPVVLPPFSAWSGPRDASVVILGEAWGAGEDIIRKPFAGVSGKELWLMLGEAWPEIAPEEHSRVAEMHRYDLAWVGHRESWLTSASLAMTNVLNLRPTNNKIPDLCSPKKDLAPTYPAGLPSLRKGLYLREEFLGELDRLAAELAACNPNLVIAMGNTAIWALLGRTDISSIRGTVTEGHLGGRSFKVLPTYHPASLFYENVWKWRPIIVADLMKAAVERTSRAIMRPARKVLFDPTLAEVRDWVARALASPPALLACDTETSLGLIDTISFASALDDGFVCQIGPHRNKVGAGYQTIWPIRDGKKVCSYWSLDEEIEFWSLVAQLLESEICKIGQNFLYDLQYLLRAGLRPRACLADTMLLHHALFPEMQKGLGFLGSIYSSEPAWKLMRRQRADSEKRDE